MTNPILSIEDIHVHFGKSHILQGVNLDVYEGMTAVVGRNGMGKTTLMSTIMGMVDSSAGKISFTNQEITHKKPYEIAQLGIGYVPQGRRIFPSLTVEEQLMTFLRNGEKAPTDSEWNLERVYDMFPRLKERRKNYGNMLSGGEQQMLAIGRALMLNPKILIMDEPSEGLAPIIIEQLIEFCHKLSNIGLSMILVEQSMYFAMNVAENVNVMQNGTFVYKGNFKELMDDSDRAEKLLGIGV